MPRGSHSLEIAAPCAAVFELVHDYSRRLEPIMLSLLAREVRERLGALKNHFARSAAVTTIA